MSTINLDKFKNKLIVFEGIDGVGKTTQAKLLNKYLNDHNIESIFTYEPGDWGKDYNKISLIFRDYCKNSNYNFTDLSTLFLFYIDRQQNIQNVILPSLLQGKTVILDRYILSSKVYQLIAKELSKKYNLNNKDMEWLLFISSLDSKGNSVTPDYTFLLQRDSSFKKTNTDKFDKFENDNSFTKKIKEGYEEEKKLNKDLKLINIEKNEKEEETLLKILLSV